MSDARVYFVKSARSKAVKIGTAHDVAARLSSLQTGSVARLTLIASMPGDERYEKALHATFAEYRIRGEWFRLEGRLAAFIAMLPAMPTNEKPPRVRRQVGMSAEELAAFRAKHEAHWQTVLPLLRDAVLSVGVERLSKATGASCSDISRAIYDRGRHFNYEWLFHLGPMLSMQKRGELLTAIYGPLGYQFEPLAAVAEVRR